jgi:hypothetical protein
VLWGSRYAGELRVGGAPGPAVSGSRVTAGGARLEAARAALRAGVDVELGRIALEGPESQGGYLFGSATRDYVLPALYAEGDRSLGRLRLSPGLRLLYDARERTLLPEPRLAARVQLTQRHALTVALTRAHQMLSTLRDERTTLPGAPFWFVHPDGAPTSRTDGVSVDLDGWLGGGWSARLGTYARRFDDVPHWRPVGVRDLASVSYDDGGAIGGEISLRRYGERASGWIGYTVSRVRFTDAATGRRYLAPWDRRHSANAALMVRPLPRLQLATRADYGSGHPIWPFAGDVVSPRLEPFLGTLEATYLVPLWGEEQYLLPSYFRIDLGMRTHVTVWGARVEPYLNLQNLTKRRNVIFYRLRSVGPTDERPAAAPQLLPTTAYGIPLPTFGFDVRF